MFFKSLPTHLILAHVKMSYFTEVVKGVVSVSTKVIMKFSWSCHKQQSPKCMWKTTNENSKQINLMKSGIMGQQFIL